MVRKIIILLCLCCVVLCAFVGYLSMQVDEQADKREGPATNFTAEEFLSAPPAETGRILLTDFSPGKHIAHADHDADEKWDELWVPMFPNRNKRIKFGYKSVIVHFKGVESKEQLQELIADRELDTDYWPERQDLSPYAHSQLAQQYKNMDFANCVSLHYGFPSSNPLLGEASLLLSKVVGAGALGIAFLVLLSFLFIGKGKDDDLSISEMVQNAATANRAGLPEI